jgi:hypothetical protein
MSSITKKELEELVELSKAVPEEYRIKCFELLLINALAATKTIPGKQPETVNITTPTSPKKFLLPIDVKAFLTQYGLHETVIWKCFLVEEGQIRQIYHPKTTKKAKAQIQTALLMALETAMSTGKFEVGIEALRTRCQEQRIYDTANFMKTLKDQANLFKGVDSKKPLSLSPDGKSELADILEELKS